MAVSSALLVLVAICAIWATVSAILLTRFLDRRGLETSFPFIGMFLFRNLGRYSEITRAETGKIGPLFYSFVIPINAAWVLALLALAVGFSGV